jgi:hypothetical protein
MTPKEKAIELVDKFMEHTVEWDNVTEYAFDSEYHAKQCALIAVDEIIRELTEEISPSVHGFRHQYWIEVEQEIAKL